MTTWQAVAKRADKRELRYFTGQGWPVRADELGEKWVRPENADVNILRGYSSTTGVWYVVRDLFGEYLESFDSRSFNKTLNDGARVAFFNHNADIPLGSTAAGTLRDGVDDTGLWYEIDADMESPNVKSVARAVERGDVSGASIAFQTVRQQWEFAEGSDELDRRTVLEARLFEHGPVTLPANPDTSAEIQVNSAAVRAVAVKFRGGQPLTAEDVCVIEKEMNNNDPMKQFEPRRAGGSNEPTTQHSGTRSSKEDASRYANHYIGSLVIAQDKLKTL